MEPVLATLTTTWAIQSILGGILGNRSNDALGLVGKFVWESLRQEKDGKPANDDLPRAVHKAHLQATAHVCELCRKELETPSNFGEVTVVALTDSPEVKWLKKVGTAINEQLRQLADKN